MDSVSPPFLFTHPGSVKAVPAAVPGFLAEGVRCGEVALLWTVGRAERTPRLRSPSCHVKEEEMGGLCQTPVRRTPASPGLRGTLYPSRGDLQPPPACDGKRSSF